MPVFLYIWWQNFIDDKFKVLENTLQISKDEVSATLGSLLHEVLLENVSLFYVDTSQVFLFIWQRPLTEELNNFSIKLLTSCFIYFFNFFIAYIKYENQHSKKITTSKNMLIHNNLLLFLIGSSKHLILSFGLLSIFCQ